MERILREKEDVNGDTVYLKVTVAGKSPDGVDKTHFYLNIFSEIDKIVSERYGVDVQRETAFIDLKDLYIYLTEELKLGFFLKGKKSVKHTCLELEGELYAENIDIFEFKRFVVLEWVEIVKIGNSFFGLNKRECHAAVGNEFIKNRVNKTKRVTGNNEIQNIAPVPPPIPVQNKPSIPDPFPVSNSIKTPPPPQNNVGVPAPVQIPEENKKIPNPFDSNGNIKTKKAKTVDGEW